MTPRRTGKPAILVVLALSTSTLADPPVVPNARFREGDTDPAAWRLSGGSGRWIDRQILEVTGSGSDSNYWSCSGVELEPGSLYLFGMRTRRRDGSGTVISGPSYANRDFRNVSRSWEWHDYVFRAPDTDAARHPVLRLGQWQATGSVQFDAVALERVVPVHRTFGGLLLGTDEAIQGGTYRFRATFGHRGSNFHRPLSEATASFNSDRWVFGPGARVVYRFELPGHRFTTARILVNVNYHVEGEGFLETSPDGARWQRLARFDGVGESRADVPAALLPAGTLLVRIVSGSSPCVFQINRVELEAPVDGAPPEGTGQTRYASFSLERESISLDGWALEDGQETGHTLLRLSVRGHEKPVTRLNVVARLISGGDGGDPVSRASGLVHREEVETLELEIPATRPGRQRIVLELEADGETAGRAELDFDVPDYHRSDYGARLATAEGSVDLWWCDATRKIWPRRAAPEALSNAAELSAARNDHEAVQLVVRPRQALEGLEATCTALEGPDGATIGRDGIEILRVAYHQITHPTDSTGVPGRWPDALPPLTGPLDVPAGGNQPLWLLVHVPAGTPPGDYRGSVRLEARGWSATVPLRLHVWNVTLPRRNPLETAFGLSAGNIYRYHQLHDEADRRRVLDLYLDIFSSHHISPYDPTPLDPIRVNFRADADPPRAEVDFTGFDRAMSHAVSDFGFTNFRLRIEGLGGGTFHSRREPRIGGFGEETPEYRALFSSYVEQVEDHLRDRGWLDMAYVYWFDEPAPRDYPFVRKGMERLKRHAPGLTRMLTEEPRDELGDLIDIWCPVSHNFDPGAAERRREHGERFWWYVCTGPKAPFCTLFIDHPATELRVWLWQTWQRKISGILVWSSNYWTSSAAFPDEPQDPYVDPMGYVSGYSTPRGVKRHWGNGDGRFIYPPESAAVPGLSGPGPVLDPPVSSIRWEMLREGIEDWMLLYLLERAIEERREVMDAQRLAHFEDLLRVPAAITTDMTHFTTDSTPIYRRRAEIARAIEELAGPSGR